jgi:hypothetical protein
MLIRYSGNPLVDLTRDDGGAGPSNAVKDEHADPRGKNNIVDDERVPVLLVLLLRRRRQALVDLVFLV